MKQRSAQRKEGLARVNGKEMIIKKYLDNLIKLAGGKF